ncbi:MAG: UDP-N-acetylmuramoyl-tripeptide--D-alanyl-D-alanine ligase [Verrucomicrobiales bacterium]|nr:UDP-N-acetylmuramoyl-tripeptide--D-alanyl-D-alanine ligase [Verrucomicrobiales bacterium]
MDPVTLKCVADWAGGALIQGVPEAAVTAVSTDSRKAGPGDLFVALKGDRFDAHDFLAQVSENGASCFLVSHLISATEGFEGGIVHVKDTLAGLQSLARGYRRSLSELRVIALTGSNGKTSTKDFLSGVLSAAHSVSKTAGNLNNHIGVPLTILRSGVEHNYGVWEMGMNHTGEIEVLAEMARPDAAVITNIGTAHIEYLGTREAIAEEKAQLPATLSDSGYCVMPHGDDFFDYVGTQTRAEMISVGFESGDVRAEGMALDESGRVHFDLVSAFSDSVPVILPVRGRHMVSNALLAAAVGLREGLSPALIAEALAAVKLSGGRLEEKSVGGYSILDDSYNANPDSMFAALSTLSEARVKGRRVAVLGYMGELGHLEEEAHLALGAQAAELKVDLLVTVGEKAARIHSRAGAVPVNLNFSTHAEAVQYLRNELSGDDLVLVKGSRGASMEKVIEGLN